MSNKIDLTHKTIGKLFVVGKTELKKGGQILWACHCDCKNFRLFTTSYLTKGICVDCGCGAQIVILKQILSTVLQKETENYTPYMQV